MTSAPPPATLAKFLRQVANQLETHGDKAIELTALLAARGYPTGGSGNGSRSSDPTSSTETAALVGSVRWHDVDRILSTQLRALWAAAVDAQSTMANVVAHGTTEDRPPAGTGYCVVKVCDEFCRPTAKAPDNRLRSGLGPSCWQAWLRYRASTRGTRAEYIAWRRAALTEPKAVPAILAGEMQTAYSERSQ